MKALMALSFHPAFYPPKSGGELRLYNIYANLSKFFKVTLVSFTHYNSSNDVEYVRHNNNFLEIRVSKTRLNLILSNIVIRFSDISECSGVITSIESRFNKNFKKILRHEALECEALIFVHPYLFTIPDELLRKKVTIYEAYNVEYSLMRQTLGNSFIGRLFLLYVYFLERRLSKRSDLVFTVSEQDKKELSNKYSINLDKIHISPNGVNRYEDLAVIREKQAGKETQPVCIFVGSYHPPNIDAVLAIVSFADRLPDSYFLIAGNVSDYFIKSGELIEFDEAKDFLFNTIVKLYHFYDLENWEGTATVWSEQKFRIGIAEGIDLIELRLYSPQPQTLDVHGEKRSEFALKEGWNILEVHNSDGQRRSVLCICEKTLSDQNRLLGIALQEISYFKNGKKIKIDLIYSLQHTMSFQRAQNVLLLGQVSEEEKVNLYQNAGLALNPMLGGSGTNIKVLDYMAAGLPVITTPIGARGLALESYENCIICEVNDFPEKISQLLCEEDLHNKLALNGRKLVEDRYNWEKIALDMRNVLDESINEKYFSIK